MAVTSNKSNDAIRSARKYIGGVMESSARLCLADAIVCYDDGDYDSAYRLAVKSLKYSVGIFHPEYKKYS